MGAGDGVGVCARVCVGAVLESERLEVGAWGVSFGASVLSEVLVSCE